MAEGGEANRFAPSDSVESAGVKLFLGGLSWETDEEKLRTHFQTYGELDEVIVMRDAVTKKPRGFGFITFQDPEAADAVCRDIHMLDGRQIDAKQSVPQEQKPRSKKIFVGGLAPDTNEAQFREHFEQFGRIADAQIMQDHLSGRSRGFGFVTFEEDSAVEKVFALGNMHELAGKRVEIKTATPRGSGSFSGRTTSLSGRGSGRLGSSGRPYDGEVDSSQSQYGYYGFGYQGMVPGYQVGYPMYGYAGMFPGYGYGYANMHPAFQMQASAFDPRTAMQYQASRGYAMGPRPGSALLPQRTQQQ